MEISCKVTEKTPGTCINQLLMEKYKQFEEQLYIVPKNEKILGSFWNQTRTLMIYHVTQYHKKSKAKKV